MQQTENPNYGFVRKIFKSDKFQRLDQDDQEAIFQTMRKAGLSDGEIQELYTEILGDRFANLPAEVIRQIALKMDLPTITFTCRTSKRFNQLICNNEAYWREKLRKDFPKAEFLYTGPANSTVYMNPKSESRYRTWRAFYRQLIEPQLEFEEEEKRDKLFNEFILFIRPLDDEWKIKRMLPIKPDESERRLLLIKRLKSLLRYVACA